MDRRNTKFLKINVLHSTHREYKQKNEDSGLRRDSYFNQSDGGLEEGEGNMTFGNSNFPESGDGFAYLDTDMVNPAYTKTLRKYLLYITYLEGKRQFKGDSFILLASESDLSKSKPYLEPQDNTHYNQI